MTNRTLHVFAFSVALLLSGCSGGGDKGATGGNNNSNSNSSSGSNNSGSSMAGTEHDKLLGEAMNLSLKMLEEVEKGKDFKEVDKEYAAQVAEMNAKLAKLPKLTVDQTNELLHRIHGAKEQAIEKKQSEIALKGGLPKLPDYFIYDVDAIKGK